MLIVKKISITIAFLVAFSQLISAGPPFDKNPTPVRQTPASPTWTGFYVGAFAGYKFSAVDHDLTLGGTFNQIPFVKGPLESRGSGELNNDGAELGGGIGFNYQLRQLVFGLEATGSYLWARKSSNTGSFVLGEEVPPLEVRTSFKTHYLVTLAPRIGVACGRFLPYITGGMALGDLDFSPEHTRSRRSSFAHCRRKEPDECRLDDWWRFAIRLHPALECKSAISIY